MNMQSHPWIGFVSGVIAVFVLALLTVSDAAEPNQSVGVLRFNNGDYLAGAFADAPGPDAPRGHVIAWQHPRFDSPFEFQLSEVSVASFPMPHDSKPAAGRFGIELWGGDRLFGSIARIDDQSIYLQTSNAGELSVSRQRLRRLFRWRDGDAVTFVDCGNLDRWQTSEGEGQWQVSGGQLRAQHDDVWLYRDIGIPSKARIDVGIEWEAKPNFAMAFGVRPVDPSGSAAMAFRIETWEDRLVAVWELEDVADVAEIGKLSEMNNQLRLSIELDQRWNDATVLSEQGLVLAEIQLKPRFVHPARPGFWLQNIDGIVALDTLQVTAGGSVSASDAVTDHDVVHLDDDQRLKGTWTDVQDDVWILTDGETDHRVDPQHVLQIDFAKHDADTKASVVASPRIQVRTHAGVRLTGVVEQFSDDQIAFQSDAVGQTLSLAAHDVRSLSVVGAVAATPRTIGGQIARLETPDSRVHGRLVDADSNALPTPLHFEPVGSASTAMLPEFSGRLVYKAPEPKIVPPTRLPQPVPVRRAPQNPAGLWDAVSRAFGNNAETQKVTGRALYLRSGEVIPCDITRIDSEGVLFQSEMTSQTRVPHDQIRAVLLVPGRSEPVVDELKRERLLTVPRMRKNHPPTHLIVAINGDVMRCRLNHLTEKTVEVETRLETIEIDRELVAQILWLGTESESQADESGLADKPAAGLQVCARLRDGNLVTMVPQSLSDGELIGHHPLLGQCRVRLSDVDELRVGDAARAHAEDQPYANWRLSDAPEPLLLDDDSGERVPGMGSPLVGMQAPDFKLDRLDGESFTLSEQRGKVVVLDFWATWCGPCLQAMPVVDDTVKAFESDEVVLVAINLQEAEEAIRATLERLKIDPIVAMDIDGVAAARYQADAIPQTVVIDRDGKVARLFVGASEKLGAQLSEAIRETLTQNPAIP